MDRGRADGQELYVKSIKTPKRYPIKDLGSTATDFLAWGLSAPGWSIARADAMVGVTHPDMGDVKTELVVMKGGAYDRTLLLKDFPANDNEANNFTSYDLFSLGFVREDVANAAETLYTRATDSTTGRLGQIEYTQLQVVVHTLPNRADSDADGLSDFEELTPGSGTN